MHLYVLELQDGFRKSALASTWLCFLLVLRIVVAKIHAYSTKQNSSQLQMKLYLLGIIPLT